MINFNITAEMFFLIADIMEEIGKLSEFSKGLDNFPKLKKEMIIKSVSATLCFDDIVVSEEQISRIMLNKRVYMEDDKLQKVKNTIKAYESLEKINPYNVEDLFKVNDILTERFEKHILDFKDECLSYLPNGRAVRKEIVSLFEFAKTNTLHPLILAVVMMIELQNIWQFWDANNTTARFWLKAMLADYKPIFRFIPIENVLLKKEYSPFKFEFYEEHVQFILECIKGAIKNFAIATHEHRNHISYQVRKLLEVMEYYPLSAQEIMNRMHLKSRAGFRQNYLNPALESGLIAMTIPDKPTSKSQMYFKV